MRFRRPAGPKGQRRNYAEGTTRSYVRAVQQFAQYFGKSPDKLGPSELRSYQAYLLKERKLAVGTVVARVAALRFFFVRNGLTLTLIVFIVLIPLFTVREFRRILGKDVWQALLLRREA